MNSYLTGGSAVNWLPSRSFEGVSTFSSTTRRSALLLALCVCGFVVTLTYTAIGVALPEISTELGAERVAATWVINTFILVFDSCVVAAGTACALVFVRKIGVNVLLGPDVLAIYSSSFQWTFLTLAAVVTPVL
ncbi:hypothetical protein OQJ46_10540 [Microbulbifer thermotolerans]|uniref:hypothetical protein n=1 Tax=Microbulbifer thermotolerans TaxID=252514 RepID=UPI00224921C2|nr:hypothetical protein [Microbulbifer thermotolerans]MCX2781232.1 hypothetical protein [Microbulbifer thermotolerans]MCX2783424.1 hypothetical protein [Microbulbifer thermotolerans]MCX2793459.1 hypothetical protein [Microbulbifer thermotolerans]MCX2803739.1 hypothetical protein [Microbulbifer thermotolerans]MCX2834944.1 hypothetical protein [Microbulbifer thermotolerans]